MSHPTGAAHCLCRHHATPDLAAPSFRDTQQALGGPAATSTVPGFDDPPQSATHRITADHPSAPEGSECPWHVN
jgi:hypothetical protein